METIWIAAAAAAAGAAASAVSFLAGAAAAMGLVRLRRGPVPDRPPEPETAAERRAERDAAERLARQLENMMNYDGTERGQRPLEQERV